MPSAGKSPASVNRRTDSSYCSFVADVGAKRIRRLIAILPGSESCRPYRYPKAGGEGRSRGSFLRPADRAMAQCENRLAVSHAGERGPVRETAGARAARLAAIARTPADSGWECHSKVRALVALVGLGKASTWQGRA